jgi:F420-dependent oxidoreductase-like protein
MRFGLFVPQGWRMDLVGIDPEHQWDAMLAVARHADKGDTFDSLWAYDHFHTVPDPSKEATHEAWILMAALGAATQRVRLGQMCTCMSYRNPAYLAKVAATVDIISGGRLEMGIGAGWYEHEWRAYGYGFPKPGDRLGRLREGVQVMRDMWTEGIASLDGKYYQVDGAICAPRPLQGTSRPGSERNGIPMWIAGGGERVTLRIAAQYADYTNFDGTPDVFSRKSDLLRDHCEAVGRDFESIVQSSNYNVIIGNTEREVQDRLDFIGSQLRRAGVSEKEAVDQVANLGRQPAVGTVEQVTEMFLDMEKRGLEYAITYFADAAHDRSGIELFEREVAPVLRA